MGGRLAVDLAARVAGPRDSRTPSPPTSASTSVPGRMPATRRVPIISTSFWISSLIRFDHHAGRGLADRVGQLDVAVAEERRGLDHAQLVEAGDRVAVRGLGLPRRSVMYDSEDPKFAAQFANTLVSEFVEQSQEMRWKASQRTGEGLEEHLNEMKANLEKSEGSLKRMPGLPD